MVRLTALLLTVLTGFGGLVYEVSWEKCPATRLGAAPRGVVERAAC